MGSLDQTVALLNLLGDPTRVRLLALLADDELSVAELCRITDLPQSRVSTHLGKLKAEGWVRDRRQGSSTHYTATARPTHASNRIWSLLHEQLDDELLVKDHRRKRGILSARQSKATWPEEVAGQMERHYSPGRTWEATAHGLLGLLELGDVLDLGSGDGVNAGLLAEHARSVTCVDRSDRIIAAAERRLRSVDNVRFCQADMHELPFADASFDQVMMFNVLTYSEQPGRAVSEAARVLREHGRLSIITLEAHGHGEVAAGYDHVNLGFSVPDLRALLSGAGLETDLCEATAKERRKPHFRILTAYARRPSATEHAPTP